MFDLDRLTTEQRNIFYTKYGTLFEQALIQVNFPRDMRNLRLINVDQIQKLRIDLSTYLYHRDSIWFPNFIW